MAEAVAPAAPESTHLCASPGCGKPASLACPTCLKLGMTPPSRFCGQECFKANWGLHKGVHKEAREAAKADPRNMPPEFRAYRFSGKLRPCQVTERLTVPPEIQKPDYASHPKGKSAEEERDKLSRDVIPVYTAEQIEGIRAACRIGREVLDIAGRAVAVGVTGDELDKIVHNETVKRGAYPSPLNYYLFPKSVCTSVNEVICHGIPDQRPLEDGDIVNIDVSVFYNGFHGDLNETFFVGNVDEDAVRLVECAYMSLAAAIDASRPGTLYRDLGDRITNVTRSRKCSVVTTYCGHGIGKLFHTAPNVPHYAGNKAKGTMQKGGSGEGSSPLFFLLSCFSPHPTLHFIHTGHIFTIEPMINLGKKDDVLWPDNWTAVTADGSRSAQFEHTMLVTETGVELLTGRIGEPTDRIFWTREKFQR